MGIKKYIYAFIISLLILFLGVYLVNSITDRKLNTVRELETGIAINILSLETQFALLQEVSCKDISQNILSKELDALAHKLQFMEESVDADNEEIRRLKKYYSLLEIKDFILMKKINERCGKELHFVLYFYSNEGDCKDCKKQGQALVQVLKERDNLRVYNFDYNLDLSATETLKKIYNVRKPLPALVIDGKLYRGYTKYEDLINLIPEGGQDLADESEPDKNLETKDSK